MEEQKEEDELRAICPKGLFCMICGLGDADGHVLLLTECDHLLCTRCTQVDHNAVFACQVCRKRSRASLEINASDPPEALRAIMRMPRDIVALILKANETQVRLKQLFADRLEERVQAASEQARRVDSETKRLDLLQRRGEKFL
ncbi:uncharacterized protein LOC108863888 [Galendromus occidentalis]|uniref:Uncharacterized protein LOC108863888 n=1 Tax=Galendromus occidentalis TaxID=34638 RepID=A0AAJ7L4V3_9ACAR|nr:uncharacterized protein LOC108863888 [Galendromus occidentalis]